MNWSLTSALDSLRLDQPVVRVTFATEHIIMMWKMLTPKLPDVWDLCVCQKPVTMC